MPKGFPCTGCVHLEKGDFDFRQIVEPSLRHFNNFESIPVGVVPAGFQREPGSDVQRGPVESVRTFQRLIHGLFGESRRFSTDGLMANVLQPHIQHPDVRQIFRQQPVAFLLFRVCRARVFPLRSRGHPGLHHGSSVSASADRSALPCSSGWPCVFSPRFLTVVWFASYFRCFAINPKRDADEKLLPADISSSFPEGMQVLPRVSTSSFCRLRNLPCMKIKFRSERQKEMGNFRRCRKDVLLNDHIKLFR